MKTALISKLLFAVTLTSSVLAYAHDSNDRGPEQCRQNIHYCECKNEYNFGFGVYFTTVDDQTGREINSRSIGRTSFSGSGAFESCMRELDTIPVCRR